MPHLRWSDTPEDEDQKELSHLRGLYDLIPHQLPGKFSTIEGQEFLKVFKPLYRSDKYKVRALAVVLGVVPQTIHNWSHQRLIRSPRITPKDQDLRELRAALRVATATKQRRRQDREWGPVHTALTALIGQGFELQDIAHETECTPRWLGWFLDPPLVASAENVARAVIAALPQQGSEPMHQPRQVR
jgi:hypothetical protein